jgi:cytochrome oxidase Cu insertion factor (SCO1/SenC/PrrC family)
VSSLLAALALWMATIALLGLALVVGYVLGDRREAPREMTQAPRAMSAPAVPKRTRRIGFRR